jgi:myosin-1
MPFPLWQTEKALFIVVSTEKDGRVTTALERRIQLVTIRAFAMSNLRDDWVVSTDLNFCQLVSISIHQALNVNSSEEGDPVFSCFFKTELMVCLNRLTRGSLQVVIGPTCVALL